MMPTEIEQRVPFVIIGNAKFLSFEKREQLEVASRHTNVWMNYMAVGEQNSKWKCA